MAAEYGININVRTQTQQLKNLQLQLKAVDNLAKSIKAQQIAPELKGGSPELLRKFKDRIAQIRNEVIVTNNAFVNNTKQINNNAGEIRGFSAALRDARANVKLFSGEYNVLTQGIQKADFTARFKEIKQFSRIAANQAANLGGNIQMAQGTTFDDLMAFRPTNTREAINDYVSMLRFLEARLDRTSDRFKQVTARIKEMENQLRSPIIRDTANQTSRPAGPRQAMAGENFFNRTFGQNRQFQQGGMFFEPGGFAARRRNALSSGLIGGGFPLLFGQGVGASIGGGIGGIAGGALGGGLGFGLSIVGTQLGKQLDILVGSAKKAGDALADFNKDTTTLIASLGLTNSAFSQRIKLLEQAEGKEAAFNVVLARTTAIVGQGGVDALKEFGDQTREITQGFSQFFLIVQAGLARIISFSRLLKGLGDGLQNLTVGERLRKSSSPELQKIGNRIAELEGKTGRLTGQERVELRGLKAKGITGLSEFDVTETNRLGFDAISKSLRQEIELTNESTFIKRQKIKVDREVNELAKQFQELTKQTLNQEQLDLLRQYVEATNELALGSRLVNDELVKLDEEFIKLNDSGFQLVELSRTIGSSFEDSFKGVIQGTMGVSEAFRNMLNKIANHFLDAAAKMAANRLATGLLGMFSGGSVVSGGIINQVAGSVGGILSKSTSGIDPKVPSGVQSPGLFNITPVPLTPSQVRNNRRGTAFKQYGGSVTRGKSYLVGERGEEVFTPGMTGRITSNSGMGSVNVSVNVDASGTSVEGNQPNGEELGRLIGAAVQTELIKEKRPGGLLG